MAQVAQSSLQWNDGLYFELCRDFLYLLLFCCSLLCETQDLSPCSQKIFLRKPTQMSQQKGFIHPFTASIKPVDDSVREFNTTPYYLLSSVYIRPSIYLHPFIYRTSTVLLRVFVVPCIYILPQIVFPLYSLPWIVFPRCSSVAK